HLPQVERTLRTLLEKPNSVLRTLLYRVDGQLQGHVCAFRSHRRTWTVQHLAVRPSGRGRLMGALLLNLAMVEHAQRTPGIEWIRVWFRPDKRWPRRVFGRFAELVSTSGLCEVRTLSYLVADSDLRAGGAGTEPASSRDLDEIERHFLASGRALQLH